ncbi:hypothetical protein HID58_069900 [Brassica napus]|uniref:Uncharacterized protein n=1 Tax=Brassica napus TaxID=3708 RepID=A0ABQ7YXB6_BRANA|nr:hypothetical protein HID58_069900 [Brassica napus]
MTSPPSKTPETVSRRSSAIEDAIDNITMIFHRLTLDSQNQNWLITVVVETNKLPKSAQPDTSLVQTSAVTVSPPSNESSVVDIAILENQLCGTLSAIPVFMSVTEMNLLMTFLVDCLQSSVAFVVQRWKGPWKLLELKIEAAKFWEHKVLR